MLHLENVVVRANHRTVLDVVSFGVGHGEIVAVVGPNGAGKSTLLHIAALLRRPDAGSVTILGTRAAPGNSASLRRVLSVVFQDPLLFDISVLANASAALRFQGVPRARAEARAVAWLERFGIGGLAGRRARTLSGGEASRVALARAFATEPTILLLDEPFSALDAPTRVALLPALRAKLRETDTAAIMVTHDLDEAAAVADRLAVMDSGAIVANGPAADLMARPPSRRAAELLGVETIISVQVTHVAGDMARVTILPAGPSFQAANRSGPPLRRGQSLTLALPAGAVRALNPDEPCPSATNCLSGVVRDVRPCALGARVVVETPAPVVALAPWRPDAHRWSAGAAARVSFSPDACCLIPEAG